MANGINTNVGSLIAQRNLFKSSSVLQTSIERLSSGLRINSARDDAAGLAIAERMTGQIRGFDVARRNAGDGISLLQVTDGALGSITDNLQRMRELALQSQNGTLTESDRSALNSEFVMLRDEVARLTQNTKFNNVSLLQGNVAGTADTTALSVELQIGANNDEELTVSVTDLEAIAANNSNTLKNAAGTANSVNFTTFNITNATAATAIAQSEDAVAAIDDFIGRVTSVRASVGAGINRLEAVINNLDTASVNLSSARGRIVDADFARETANLTRAQILQQAGTAMLAQANQLPANVLALLG